MSGKMDIAGLAFGRLVAVRPNEINGIYSGKWHCRCSCGTEKLITVSSLRSGGTKSCGCLKENFLVTHGFHSRKNATKIQRKTYAAWRNIKQRCFNPKDCNYHNYGARGITICDRWKNSFENFVSDMGFPLLLKCRLEESTTTGHTRQRIVDGKTICSKTEIGVTMFLLRSTGAQKHSRNGRG